MSLAAGAVKLRWSRRLVGDFRPIVRVLARAGIASHEPAVMPGFLRRRFGQLEDGREADGKTRKRTMEVVSG